MSSATPKFTQKASLPDGLQDLLVREAAFALSRKRINDALAVAQQQKTAVASARPLLSFLFRDNQKDHNAKRREMVENVSVLEAGVQKLDAAIPILHLCVERSVENYLREYDAEYANGLASSRFLDDWQRLLSRFDQSVSHYLTLLGRLPGVMELVAPSETAGSSLECRKLIDTTASAARELQDEITFLNKVADSQRIRSGVDSITLYRQPERNWKGTIHSLLFEQPGPGVQSIGGLIAESVEIVEKIRGAIQGECQLASYVVGYGVTSYHQRVWASLRESATLRIDPDQLEAILADTEERMDLGNLLPWVVPKAELPPEVVAAAVPAPPPPKRQPDASAPPAPAAMGPIAGAPPSVVVRSPTKAPNLRLPSRNGTAAQAPAQNAIVGVGELTAAQTAQTAAAVDQATKEAADTVADLTAERIRLEEILAETRAGFDQREVFLSQSEERLLQKSQAQLEREVELEQREEQLLDLEKRLREKLGAAAVPDSQPVEKKAFDEFNE